ncbi:hypothetical protein TrLO_g11655 [Triparma laevis f. longispina]|uniref:Uncharacterized protein n=1 Tax=Triparma laevis f. longispina TaxID=1714387 RepID=A0A9W7CBB6_9STRA|nr:hypothetical protein TrLO_g11655 [Triparma laevis f. longispina]
MGLSALAIKFAAKVMGKGLLGMTLIGNTLLPKFIKNALHVEEAEEVDAHPSIFMDPEVWLLVGLIAFALVVTQEKKGKEKEKEK